LLFLYNRPVRALHPRGYEPAEAVADGAAESDAGGEEKVGAVGEVEGEDGGAVVLYLLASSFFPPSA